MGITKWFLLNLVLLLCMVSCKQSFTNETSEVAARIGEQKLLKKDIPNNFPPGCSQADSEKIVKKYVTTWVRNKVLMTRAEENLNEQQKIDINKQIEETKSALMIYKYEQEMIRQRLDTVITDEEIQSYYNSHQNNFLLKKNIVKALFIKIPISAPNIDNVRKWYRSEDNSDLNSLESYSYQFANKFDDFNEDWVYFDVVLSEIPTVVNNPERFLRRTKFIETSDSLYYYFVNLRDYKLKRTIAPPEIVKSQIKSVIRNQRKISFIQNLENNLINDAADRNEFVIY